MPLYEFRCKGCGHEFEDLVPAVGACGSCGDPRGPGACSTN